MAKKTIGASSGTRKRGVASATPAKKRREIKKPREDRDLYRRLDDIKASDADPLEKYAQRKRATESWRKRTRIHDVERAQAQHSPTVEVAVDDPEDTKKTRRNSTRVRQSEVWRHNQLTVMQRSAESEMGLAWQARTAGLGAASSRYGDVRGAAGESLTLGAELDVTWRAWWSEARKRKISVRVVIDCISEPLSLRDIERNRKLESGAALAVYQRGLDLWCQIRGWSRSPVSTPLGGLTAPG
jgi:hypothetical protein